MAKLNKSGRTRGVLWTHIRQYAGVSQKPFNSLELALAKLMTPEQAKDNCVQLCREGELKRIERGVYCATARLKV